MVPVCVDRIRCEKPESACVRSAVRVIRIHCCLPRVSLVHLLRELEKVDLKNDSAEWLAFSKKLRRLLRDGIRLRKRENFAVGALQDWVNRLNAHLAALASREPVDNDDTHHLTKRSRKHAECVAGRLLMFARPAEQGGPGFVRHTGSFQRNIVARSLRA